MNPSKRFARPATVRRELCLGLALVSAVLARTAGVSAPAGPVELQSRLSSLLSQPQFHPARWGVWVCSLDSGTVLFATNADELFIPASNAKLFTTAVAIDALGLNHRVRTSIYATERPSREGIVRGDLILFGRGDPTFSASRHGGNLEAAVAPLVEPLVAAGLRRVEGDLVADESAFRGPAVCPSWDRADLIYGYAAEVSALSINDNAVEIAVAAAPAVTAPPWVTVNPATDYLAVRNRAITVPAGQSNGLRIVRPPSSNVVVIQGWIAVGARPTQETLSVTRPALWFGQALRAAMLRRGIVVAGGVRVVDADARGGRAFRPEEFVELAGA